MDMPLNLDNERLRLLWVLLARASWEAIYEDTAADLRRARIERCGGEDCPCTLCEQDREDEQLLLNDGCLVCGRTDPECQACRAWGPA